MTFFGHRMTWGRHTYVDRDDNRILSVEFDETFWERGEFDALDGVDNPWDGRSSSAPFDRGFYIILNVAVGESPCLRVPASPPDPREGFGRDARAPRLPYP